MKNKIISIDAIEDEERWVPIPSVSPGRNSRRLKGLFLKKGNCYFARGVPKGIFNFIYRASLKLQLKDKNIIFSRGSVKERDKRIISRMSIEILEWDVGISCIIPRQIRYDKNLPLLVGDSFHKVRYVEIIVLKGLLGLAFGSKSDSWCNAMAVNIITKGWKSLENKKVDEVFILPEVKNPSEQEEF